MPWPSPFQAAYCTYNYLIFQMEEFWKVCDNFGRVPRQHTIEDVAFTGHKMSSGPVALTPTNVDTRSPQQPHILGFSIRRSVLGLAKE
jgi:hypothetical protein